MNTELLQSTRQLFVRERLAPEVLPYETELVEQCMEVITEKENELLEQENSSEFDVLSRTLKEMELDRLRYFLKSYLRARLYKIENHHAYYLEEHGALSLQEKEYVRKFAQAVQTHFDDSFLNLLDENTASLENVRESLKAPPKVDSFCFGLVKETVGSVPVDDTSTIEMVEGRIIGFPFVIFRELLLEGKLELL
mmetsp:Transcript_39258/g.100612  ORF Transcript_39258/g.100612 Transcript_39258/m.100612 type:complete len:195 (-) Transcript_39258:483-1067(-)